MKIHRPRLKDTSVSPEVREFGERAYDCYLVSRQLATQSRELAQGTRELLKKARSRRLETMSIRATEANRRNENVIETGRPMTTAADGFLAAKAQFIITELQLGITFANLALSASFGEDDKEQRNGTNARKAYDTARRLLQSGTTSTGEELERIKQLVATLHGKLELLETSDHA